MLRWCVRGGLSLVARALGPLLVGWPSGHWGVTERRESRPPGRGVGLWVGAAIEWRPWFARGVIGTVASAACGPRCEVVCVCECMSKARLRWWSQRRRSRPGPGSRSDQGGAVPPPFLSVADDSLLVVLAAPGPGVRAGAAKCTLVDERSCSSAVVGVVGCVCVCVCVWIWDAPSPAGCV